MSPTKHLMEFIITLVGILVSLSVGFAMFSGNLLFPIWLGGLLASVIVGATILAATLAAIILVIIKK